jgi:hypothetical protein
MNQLANAARVLIIASLFALAIASGATHAEPWIRAGTSDDGNIKTAVETSSIQIAGTTRRARIQRTFASHTQRGVGENANKWATKVVGVNAYKCDADVFRTESLIWYFDDGTDYATPMALFPGPWMPVGPDTVVRAERKVICGWRPK